MKQEIRNAMHQVNYRRRTRWVRERDVIEVLREACEAEYGWTSGGIVANAYDYPASTAAVAAIKLDNLTFALRFGTCDAHRAHSRVTWFGPSSKRHSAVCRWLSGVQAEWKVNGKRPDGDWILLTRGEVNAMLGEVEP